MAATTIHGEIARLKWPGYEITGSGPLAVVYHCCRKVILCSLPIEAQAIADERCGPGCSHKVSPEGGFHRIVTLTVPTRRMLTRSFADWED